MMRRLAAVGAALGLTLMLAGPALANDLAQTVPPGGISAADAPQGTDEDCAGLNLQPGQILWHFVHTMTDGSDLPSTLTATFESGTFPPVAGYSNGGGSAQVMYDVITTTADGNLLGASDTIVNDGLLNLSHVCGGPPPEVPEAPASIMLLLAGGLAGLAFLGWRMRRSATVA